jgi:hypothetical protein
MRRQQEPFGARSRLPAVGKQRAAAVAVAVVDRPPDRKQESIEGMKGETNAANDNRTDRPTDRGTGEGPKVHLVLAWPLSSCEIIRNK